jgi:putative membrane protein
MMPARSISIISRLVIRLGVLAVGIYIAANVVPGISFDDYGPLVAGAALLGLFNIFIKPILSILTLPITCLTLGLFTFIVNGIILWAVGQFIHGLNVEGLLSAVLGGVVISIFSIFINRLV